MKAVLLGIFLGSGGAAWASCHGLALDSLAEPSYSFNNGTEPTLSLRVSKSHGSCDFFLTIDYGSASSHSGRALRRSGGHSIPMNLYRNSSRTSVVKDIPEADSDHEVITGDLGGGSSSQTLRYYPKLEAPDTYARFGSYSESFTIKLYEGEVDKKNTFQNSRTVTFTYSMPKTIDLSLVESGGSFNPSDTSQTLSFGTLTAGASRSFDILLKYNAGYNVRISSANQGRLKHASLADSVPYTLSVNSSVVNLVGSHVSPVTASSGSGVSAASGLRLPSSVTIGSLGSARAGSYADVVTVTVVSAE